MVREMCLSVSKFLICQKVAKDVQDMATEDVIVLLESAIHEERLLALLILVRKYVKGDETAKKRIYGLYLEKTKFINNWDLVDGSAHHIVGNYLMDKDMPRTMLRYAIEKFPEPKRQKHLKGKI